MQRVSTAQPLGFVSNAPTTFYRQHHTVEAPAVNEREFRPAWRVKTKLWLLLECARIDRRQLEAALAFRGWIEAIGRQRSSTWLALHVDGGRQPEGVIAAHQLDAARHLHDAGQALGTDRLKLLYWAVVDDLSWVAIGKRIGLSKRTANCRVVEAIVALAQWRRGHPVPPPPCNRVRIEPRRW